MLWSVVESESQIIIIFVLLEIVPCGGIFLLTCLKISELIFFSIFILLLRPSIKTKEEDVVNNNKIKILQIRIAIF